MPTTTTKKPASRKAAVRKPAARKTASSKNGAAGKTTSRRSSPAAAAGTAGKINGPAYKGAITWPGPNVKPKYSEAVKVFQHYLRERVDRKLLVDGYFGPKTWHCLNRWMEEHPAAREISYTCAARTFHSLVNDVKC